MNKLRLINKADAQRMQEFEGSEALAAAREVAAASKLTVEKIMNLDGKDFPAFAGMLDRAMKTWQHANQQLLAMEMATDGLLDKAALVNIINGICGDQVASIDAHLDGETPDGPFHRYCNAIIDDMASRVCLRLGGKLRALATGGEKCNATTDYK